jgi:hypothetical protein
MKLFRLPKRDPGRFAEDPPLLKALRCILLVLLFGGVVFGVWLNSQKQAALREKSAPARMDRLGSLPDGSRTAGKTFSLPGAAAARPS